MSPQEFHQETGSLIARYDMNWSPGGGVEQFQIWDWIVVTGRKPRSWVGPNPAYHMVPRARENGSRGVRRAEKIGGSSLDNFCSQPAVPTLLLKPPRLLSPFLLMLQP